MTKKFKSKGDAIRKLKMENWSLILKIPFRNKKTKRTETIDIIYDSGTGYYYTFYGLKLIGRRTNQLSAITLGESLAKIKER